MSGYGQDNSRDTFTSSQDGTYNHPSAGSATSGFAPITSDSNSGAGNSSYGANNSTSSGYGTGSGAQDAFSNPSSRSALGSSGQGERFPGQVSERNDEYLNSRETGSNYNSATNVNAAPSHTQAGFSAADADTSGVGRSALDHTSGSGTDRTSASHNIGGLDSSSGNYGSGNSYGSSDRTGQYGAAGTAAAGAGALGGAAAYSSSRGNDNDFGSGSGNQTTTGDVQNKAEQKFNEYTTDRNTADPSPGGTGSSNLGAGTGNQRLDATIGQKIDENTDKDGFTNLTGDRTFGPLTGRVKNDAHTNEGPVIETTKERSERDEQGRELDSRGNPYEL